MSFHILSIVLLVVLSGSNSDKESHQSVQKHRFKTVHELIENRNIDILEVRLFQNGISGIEFVDYSDEESSTKVSQVLVRPDGKLIPFPMQEMNDSKVSLFMEAVNMALGLKGEKGSPDPGCEIVEVVKLEITDMPNGGICVKMMGKAECNDQITCTFMINLCKDANGKITSCIVQVACWYPGVTPTFFKYDCSGPTLVPLEPGLQVIPAAEQEKPPEEPIWASF